VAEYRTFKDYVSAGGENEIRTWLDVLPKAAKVKINALIRRLQVVPFLDMPEVRMLRGECDGLLELRVTAEKVQYRPLCCYGPGRGEVTILVGAIEKGSKFVPLTACAIAQTRKARLAEGGRTLDHDFG
jgi:hypothetical protein